MSPWEPGTLALLILTFVGAGLIQGLTGFGSVLFAVPIVLTVLEPRLGVVVTQLAVMWISIGMAARLWSSVRLIETVIIVLASAPGVVLGSLALRYWPAWGIKIVVGSAVVLATVPLLLSIRRRISRERLAAVPAGFVGGLLQGATGMAGPPVVILLSNQGWGQDAFRGTMSLYLGVAGLWAMGVYWQAGLLTSEIGWLGLTLMPGLVLGSIVGSRLVSRINAALFARMVVLLVLAGGLLTLATGALEGGRQPGG
ncbi:MAG: sulfite exporter TauE/SafE family protein [Chloroflexota bacterium]